MFSLAEYDEESESIVRSITSGRLEILRLWTEALKRSSP